MSFTEVHNPITFFVIMEEGADREVKDRAAIKKAMDDKFKMIDWAQPFSLHDNDLYLTTLSDMTAAEYLDSYPWDLNSLSFARRIQKSF